MIFRYEILALGSRQTGHLSARNEGEAMDRILLYFPDSSLLDLSVDWMSSLFSVSQAKNGTFTPKSAAVFSERIAIYLESGLDPGQAVELIKNQDPVFRTLSELILMARRSGARFISCLGLAGFPRDFLPILSAAEESGNLATSFRKVAGTLSTLSKLKSDVMKNLFVPAIEIVLMVVFLIFAFFFLLPRMARIFGQFPGSGKPSGLLALSLYPSANPGVAAAVFLMALGSLVAVISLRSFRVGPRDRRRLCRRGEHASDDSAQVNRLRGPKPARSQGWGAFSAPGRDDLRETAPAASEPQGEGDFGQHGL